MAIAFSGKDFDDFIKRYNGYNPGEERLASFIAMTVIDKVREIYAKNNSKKPVYGRDFEIWNDLNRLPELQKDPIELERIIRRHFISQHVSRLTRDFRDESEELEDSRQNDWEFRSDKKLPWKKKNGKRSKTPQIPQHGRSLKTDIPNSIKKRAEKADNGKKKKK